MNEKDKPQMDWQQVVLNGGPPCFAVGIPHTIPNKYCGRAERWEGHGSKHGHEYVSLSDLLTTARKEAGEAAWKKAIKVVEAVHRNTMGSVSDWQVLGPLESAMKKEIEAAANTEEGGGDG